MRTKIVLQSTLAGGLAVLALAACSSATNANAATTSQGVETDNAAAPQGDHHPSKHRDPAKFIEHFDRDKNGSVEFDELPKRLRMQFADADSNDDGKITLDELKAKLEAHRAKRFEKLDTNGDGSITKNEVSEERWARLSKADADGNGSVTKAELEQAFESGALKKGHGEDGKGPHFRPDPAKMIEHFDRDKNGTLEVSELPEKMKARFGDADANKDGKLDLDEIKAYIASHRPPMPPPGDEMAWHGHGEDGKGPHFRPDPAKMIERFDRDKNGTLEVSELPEKMKARLADADTNKDGKLDLDEIKAHIASHHPPEPPAGEEPPAGDNPAQ